MRSMTVSGKVAKSMVVACGREQTGSRISENGKMVKLKDLVYMS